MNSAYEKIVERIEGKKEMLNKPKTISYD